MPPGARALPGNRFTTIRSVDAERFVGRDAELALVRDLAGRVAGGAGGVLLVTGEQGVGKTTLLREGLAGAGAAGCRLGWGAADEVAQRFPLLLMAECLGEDGRLAVESTGGGEADAGSRVSAAGGPGPRGRGLRGPGPRGPGLRAPVLPGDPVLAGMERLLALADRLCAASPVVVVAEDLQWADEASLLVWERLSQAISQLPLLLVGSCRPVATGGGAGRLARSVAARHGTVVPLGSLSPGEVADLAGALLGARPGRQLAGLLERAGGNPLYVRELVDGLVRGERLRVAGGAAEMVGDSEPVPVSLALAIAERLRALPQEAAEVLRWAAVLGQEFLVTDLSVVTGWPAGDLVAVVEQAVAAGVVAEAGPRLRFRHGLIRQVLFEEIPAAARDARHVQAAQALAAAGSPPQRVAAQLAAAPGAAGEWAWEWLAGALPGLGYRAPQVTAELLRRVLSGVPEGDPRREALEVGLVQVARLLMAYDEVERAARPLLARTADPGRAAEVGWLLAFTLVRSGRASRAAEAIDVVEAALARPGIGQVWAARLRALGAMSHVLLGRWDWAARAAKQALAGGELARDRFAVGYALQVLSALAYQRRDHTAVLSHLDRALAVIGDDPQTSDLRLTQLAERISALANLDRHGEADTTIQEALALAERVGTPRLGQICCHAAAYYYIAGRWDDALAVLEPATGLPGPDFLPVWLHALSALIAGHRDDPDTAGQHLAAVADQEIGSVSLPAVAYCLLAARTMAAARAGRLDVMMELLGQCLEPGVAVDTQERYLLLPLLVRVALAARDAATAAAAARAAAEEAELGALPVKAAAAGLCRGLVAGDPGPVLSAATYYQSASRPFDQALALEDAAVLLARRGEQPAARRAFTSAARLYRELGAPWHLHRADARLHRYGIRRGRAGQRAGPAQGWEALTPTETKIAQLVAEGRSNPDIAAELFLSRNTVQTHVSHILAKLGARSRGEIVRQALDRAGTEQPAT